MTEGLRKVQAIVQPLTAVRGPEHETRNQGAAPKPEKKQTAKDPKNQKRGQAASQCQIFTLSRPLEPK